MKLRLIRSTLSVAWVLACCGCAPETAKPAAPPTRAAPREWTVLPVVDAFVEVQAIRCSWGLAEPCRFAGEAYHLGIGVPRDLERASSYFQRACVLGSMDGCAMSGAMTVVRGDRAHFADVFPLWERACENGSYLACSKAGIALALDPQGLGIPRDMPRGRRYLAKACAARFLPACGAGSALVFELKETASYATARQQLIEACELHERESCHYLGQAELDGTLGVRDEHAAGNYFWDACRDDWGPSCSALAYMHAKGIGTPVNFDQARKLTSRACVLEFQPACEVLRHPERELPRP
jgi:TPR repeat protein